MSFPLVLQLQVVASCIAKMPGPALGPSEEQSLGQTFLVLSNGSAHRHTHTGHYTLGICDTMGVWRSVDHFVGLVLSCTFRWVLGIELRSLGLHSKPLYPLSPLTNPGVCL